MKKAPGLLSCILFAIGLVSCNFPLPTVDGTQGQEKIGQYQTVAVLLTRTAQAVVTQKPTQAPTGSQSAVTPTARLEILTNTPDAQPALETQPGTPQAVVPPVPCDIARAGMPFDVTIPDDTQVFPGEYFSKTWRLVNAGSCNWDRDYAVVWFSGDELGLNRAQSFNGVVAVGQTIDITVDMQAPETPGVYQSNWKLRNNQGVLFGIGPGSTAPFWARIVVVALATETPTTTPQPPTVTPTVVVYNSGTASLLVDAGFDFDSGANDQLLKDDLRLRLNDQGQAQLQPENGARLALVGRAVPQFSDCASLSLNTGPVGVADAQIGDYLCYRTTEGLPGWVALSAYDSQSQSVSMEFLTWVVP